ncbi:Ion transport protein-domain-containing protein [Protomyces lactucae-debilis]|uniref:Calcium-channel protein CCH1 n=1 Tax=Protomyces lactucae-debilis TaxID=2754530 RepID=A0A1Y2FT27_PROLT|nr:Ion transport protein-domain-containing protein [Protomyces lactucae-debilis]ORY87152.1 Ion transport protein-domain-containing protein [Protomyces lactucae-debilis]
MRRKVSLALANTSQRVVNLRGPATKAESKARPGRDGDRVGSDTLAQPQLAGRALGFLKPENGLRQVCFHVLRHPVTEPLVLLVILLHAIILAADSFTAEANGWGDWTDWTLLGIFTFYTLELGTRLIVSGVLFNPEEQSARNAPGAPPPSSTALPQHLSAYNRTMPIVATLGRSREQAVSNSIKFVRRAFLRKSANRFDLICVLSFWLSFGLSVTGVELKYHFYLFRVISSLRIIRLLNITEATATILRSLKTAGPLLSDVAFFVAFFWVFTAIIGVQAFKGSLRRSCVWVDPSGLQANITTELQSCGGHLSDGVARGYLLDNWQSSNDAPKGYLCPEQSYCVQGSNPYGGTVSFDTIWNAMELVFVIISSNTSTDLMYQTMASDRFLACLFFICSTLLLTFWLSSLFIAVVTNSFSVNREEQRRLAAKAKAVKRNLQTNPSPGAAQPPGLKFWSRMNGFWLSVIVISLAADGARKAHMSAQSKFILDTAEVVFTVMFAVEIVLRFLAHLPNWRSFLTKSNIFDSFLVLITCLIEVPQIRGIGSNDELYRWLSVFQILRVYRVIHAIPFTRHLLARIVGDVHSLLNLLFFVMVSVLIGALLAAQLLRGEVSDELYGEQQFVTFKNIYNSFFGMYQIMSTENWTVILYGIQMAQAKWKMAWLGATFAIVWFIYAQFIMMSLFISVLSESLEVSEEAKRREQVKTFVQRTLPSLVGHDKATPAMATIVKRSRPRSATIDEFGNMMNAKSVQAFLADEIEPLGKRAMTMQNQFQGPILRLWDTCVAKVMPLSSKSPEQRNPFSSRFELVTEESISSMQPHTIAEQVIEAHGDLRMQQLAYLARHPEYNYALWFLKPQAKLRSWCQYLVACSWGERMQGHPPSAKLWYAFSAVTYACTLCIVISACMVTPIYQKAYKLQGGQHGIAWYTWLDLGLTVVFTLEACCKVFADGFYLTPNGYLRNTWNRLDFMVLCTLWVNCVADIVDDGSVSRAFRAFKALRALRLVNISDKTKEIFHDVLIAGFWNILGAAVASLALLIPTAIWAQKMFSGLLAGCNDSDVANKASCINEFFSTPAAWSILVPRQWANPRSYSFDDFGSSLLILFEIVSQEGWTAVAASAAGITGKDLQPQFQPEASTENRMFFVLFNMAGAVFVLTLFIAVILQNYSERSGLAFLTTDQRSWQEIKLLLSQVRPSRRPADAPKTKWRRWAFFAVKKHSTWQRSVFAVYVIHTVILMTEHFASKPAYMITRNTLFFVILAFYAVNLAVRVVGLGWRLFLKSRWNIYNLAILPFAMTASVLTAIYADNVAFGTLQKVSLVLLAMNLIHAIDSLDTLAKVASASVPILASLFATWLVLFITFAIAFNQILGLVKIGDNGDHNLNMRSVSKALVALYRMSLGEGWNAFMHDFTVQEPYCTDSANFYDSDCGNPAWAYFLFIAWNTMSMYIFVNIVLSLVMANFSYVYQRTGFMGNITRDQIRQFKQVWAKFDDGTGHIATEDVAKFLHNLTGVFEVKIYPQELCVGRLLAECTLPSANPSTREVNLALLRSSLRNIDVDTIKKRRLIYESIHTELTRIDPKNRVSFGQTLLVIAYNKFIDQDRSLQLLEFFRRREIRIRVMRSLRQEQVVIFLERAWSKRKLAKNKMVLDGNFDSSYLSLETEDIGNSPTAMASTNAAQPMHSSRHVSSRSVTSALPINQLAEADTEEKALDDLLHKSVWAEAFAEDTTQMQLRH